ncbi:MAG: hypothetical protein TQ37_07710 [Candidatus Synechococcus spongiarum 15L]|uniref:PIN domain-containing protein n=1 Tax=Candidatus Synechococcus spongiarum 15L TaxID=1608419 RepID=A0A0G8AT58_9SYNE|nr:MAG: hypothetical protein TQ37_07710 [Candidatus Synechococcus spongiarum 15L]
MGEIVIVDTSILLNVLDVPGRNQNRKSVFRDFEACISRKATFLVPLGVVLETSNHIARISDGNKRRKHAEAFRDEMTKALAGDPSWGLILLRDGKHEQQLHSWLNGFPDEATRGIGLVDLSIIREWEAACKRHSLSRVRVRIWSLDKNHLAGYDRKPG